MDNEIFLRAAAAGIEQPEGQAEVAASTAETVENQVSAEMAVDQTPNEEITTPATEVIQPEPVAHDYWNDLNAKTEGLVKDEDSLTSLIQKVKEYDTLAAEKQSLFKPANDYIAKLNEMTLAGASQDQIKAFVTLNGYGDLTALSPIDLKVTKMVLTEGYSEAMARKIVNREFDFSQFDERDPDQKDEADIMREKLRIDSKKDLEVLNEYRKEITTVNNPEKELAEQTRLKSIADMAQYNSTVETAAPSIAKNFPTKLDYSFKLGEDTVVYEDSFDKEFLEKDLVMHVKEWFKDSGDPINMDTITEAYSFALGEYLKKYDAKRLENAYKKGHSSGFEQAVNKYENRSGLPKAQDNQIAELQDNSLFDFTRKMVGM